MKTKFNNNNNSDDNYFSVSRYLIFLFLPYLIVLTLLVVLSVLFKDDIIELKDKIESIYSESESNSNFVFLNYKNTNMLTLDERDDVEILSNNSIINDKLNYCIGDIIDTGIAEFQVIGCYKSDETDSTDVYNIEFILYNKSMYGGITMYENTGKVRNNSPTITVSDNNSNVSKPLNLSTEDSSFNTVISRGNASRFVGKFHVAKGDEPKELIFRFGENYSDIRTVSLNHVIKDLRKNIITTDGNNVDFSGVFKAECKDEFNIDALTFKVDGKYYRSEDSNYNREVRGNSDNEDIAVFLTITNNTSDKINLAEMFDFILYDSDNNTMYRESIYEDVNNQINNTNWNHVLDLGESYTGVINFEAPKGSHSLLIRKHIEPYNNDSRLDNDFIAVINLD